MSAIREKYILSQRKNCQDPSLSCTPRFPPRGIPDYSIICYKQEKGEKKRKKSTIKNPRGIHKKIARVSSREEGILLIIFTGFIYQIKQINSLLSYSTIDHKINQQL